MRKVIHYIHRYMRGKILVCTFSFCEAPKKIAPIRELGLHPQTNCGIVESLGLIRLYTRLFIQQKSNSKKQKSYPHISQKLHFVKTAKNRQRKKVNLSKAN